MATRRAGRRVAVGENRSTSAVSMEHLQYGNVLDALDLFSSVVSNTAPGAAGAQVVAELTPGLRAGRALIQQLASHGDVAAAVESVATRWMRVDGAQASEHTAAVLRPPAPLGRSTTDEQEDADIVAVEEALTLAEARTAHALAHATGAEKENQRAVEAMVLMAEDEQNQITALEEAQRAIRTAETRAAQAELRVKDLELKYRINGEHKRSEHRRDDLPS
eukprot:COSAG05_NODE_8797_length_670_cov_1.977233_1_plen_219_part_10